MEHKEIGAVDGVPIRVPAIDDYRKCDQPGCGRECVPDPGFSSDDHGSRIAFACAEHELHSVVDPFEWLR